MSLRVILCTLYVVFFAFYARRDWFASLCATIVLMAFFQHPDMPKSIAGIQGMNLWNILMFSVMLCWWAERRRLGLTWDAPPWVKRLLLAYFAVVAVSVLRLLANPSGWEDPRASWMISEYFINCYKWVLPGIILFDACRTRRRAVIALYSIMALYFLLAVQVIKHVPISYATADSFQHLAYKLIQESVGYNRVTLSMMLAGASWAMLAMLSLTKIKKYRLAILGVAGAIALGQALTGGRSGYTGWLAVGLVLGIARWRRMLIVIPIVVAVVCYLLPAVRDRMLMGMGIGGDNANADAYEMTSGRNIAWPCVIDKIKEGPVFGFGRCAMITTGVYERILIQTDGDESFPHPHNAYLEILLDCGLVGFFAVVPFYLVALRNGFRLFLDKTDPLYSAAGGVGSALILALLVSAMGGETFYPREGAVGMWAAMGVMLRVYVERNRAKEEDAPLFGESETSGDPSGARVQTSEIPA
jgi:hypothetical protein